MHALYFILISLTLSFATEAIIRNSDECFETHGSWTNEPFIKSEFQYFNMAFLRYMKSPCNRGQLKLVWLKNEKMIKSEIPKRGKRRRDILSRLLFYSLSRSDAGNYTLWISNAAIDYRHNMTLIVNGASATLRRLRQHVAPEHENLLETGRLYWMPKMIESEKVEIANAYGDDALHCRFFSMAELARPSATWSLEYGDRVYTLVNSSRVPMQTTELECDFDPWMPSYGGYCYVSTISFLPFLPSDGAKYICKVRDYLQATFHLVERFSDFNHPLIPPINVLLENTLEFNKNETICSGSIYIFNCSSSTTDSGLTLYQLNSSGFENRILSTNVSMLIYNLRGAQSDHTGHYICREATTNSKQMFLNVQDCFAATMFLSIVVPLTILIIIGVLIFASMKCWKIHRHKKSVDKIQWLSKFKVEGMYRNERYIPLHTDLNWEIPITNITMTSDVLGMGEFGKVLRGKLVFNDVALKISKPGGYAMLQQEIEVMKGLGHHDNVIKLLGVSYLEGELMAILEIAKGGNLRDYLRAHNPILNNSCEQIGLEQLLIFATQIVNGMVYLSSKNVIHRDLAARNCLLTSNLSIKLSDFGLTRLTTSKYVNDTQGRNPVAWMAPESISSNSFTSKSDVWSFGVVMWEVFELGACPYPGMTHSEIKMAVSLGNINTQPPLASDAVYAIMMACWATDPTLRPSFLELKEHLDEVDVNEYL